MTFFFFFFSLRAKKRWEHATHVNAGCRGRCGNSGPIERAAVASRPIEEGQVTSQKSLLARPLIPGAALASEPLERFQVAASGCLAASLLIVPLAPILSQPLEHRQVASRSCGGAHARLIVWVSFLLHPLQDIELAALGGTQGHVVAELQILSFRPLENEQLTFLCSDGGHVLVPL